MSNGDRDIVAEKRYRHALEIVARRLAVISDDVGLVGRPGPEGPPGADSTVPGSRRSDGFHPTAKARKGSEAKKGRDGVNGPPGAVRDPARPRRDRQAPPGPQDPGWR